jgi:TRAP transporter TAXI family solute receptor
MTTPPPPLPGQPTRPYDPQWIGGYEVRSLLGEGGMGTVYYAVTDRGDPVAVKVIRAEYVQIPGFRDRFLREIENAQRVQPFCTAAVLAFDTTSRTPYLVTEYVDGPDLRRQVTEGDTLSGIDTKRFAIGIATALRAIHSAGIVHRDLKPGNVLLARHGARVIDFGVASALVGNRGTGTGGGSGPGAGGQSGGGGAGGREDGGQSTEPDDVPQWLTPAYMAPEQAHLARYRGQVEITPAVDIFAWAGVVLYAATGRTPFGDGDFAELFDRVSYEQPNLDGLPDDLRLIVASALHKNPRQRPTARQLLAALVDDGETDPVQAGHAEARRGWDTTVVVRPRAEATVGVPPPDSVPAGPTDSRDDRSTYQPVPLPEPRRRRAAVAVAAGVVAVLLAAVLWFVLRPDGKDTPAQLGACPTVAVQTGQRNTPYYRYGVALQQHIEARYPGTSVNVVATNGTADNLNRLQDAASSTCVMSISQLNTTVDARIGVNQFLNSPLGGLRSVGPLWLDLVHLMVREDSSVTSPAQLCGRTVSSGLLNSGSLQISQVLFDNVLRCPTTPRPENLDAGLADLKAGRVDALLWAGGAPTPQITQAIGAGVRVRMLPLADYVGPMTRNWDDYYRPRLGTQFVAGRVYETATISPQDYAGVGEVATVGTPNGLVVNQSADPALIAFTARDLVEHRTDYETALWGAGSGGRHFESPRQAITNSSLYCLIPLAADAARYYATLGIQPDCGRG